MAGSSKPYNNRVNKNTNRRSNNRRNTSNNREKKELDATTRIRIDNDRLNDSDSLDTSFLEGRIDKRVKNNKKAKEKILKEKKKSKINFKLLRNIIGVLLLLCIIIVGIVFLINSDIMKSKDKNVSKPQVMVKEKKVTVVDDNYLFLGDFHTKDLDFSDVYNHYVNVSGEDYTVTDILDNMKEYVYDYNPSIVFIELGINDLIKGDSQKDVLDNIENLITSIQSNREYAKIYVESLYPINEEIDDYDNDIMNGITIDDISSFNDKLKKICSNNKVSYLDVYSELSEDEVLKENYTDDGVYLNNAGLKRVLKVINRVVDDVE